MAGKYRSGKWHTRTGLPIQLRPRNSTGEKGTLFWLLLPSRLGEPLALLCHLRDPAHIDSSTVAFPRPEGVPSIWVAELVEAPVTVLQWTSSDANSLSVFLRLGNSHPVNLVEPSVCGKNVHACVEESDHVRGPSRSELRGDCKVQRKPHIYGKGESAVLLLLESTASGVLGLQRLQHAGSFVEAPRLQRQLSGCGARA
ncbi:hypothetical protein MJG53_009696 [Ovis ammon polii x Ovis aries]|uniref:Uncharacterized protein n=1 Tax=Ovis ammon polii x Ovis aries TaxID=2918886 RepID=A0ACB9UY83_9CETA|nr:hypothetical protein MJG53_009696 [Ovis ammon polii x Ovis aries]